MKTKSLLICLFSLGCFTAFSQNWRLAASGNKYNFQLNTADFITNTIRVDSAAAVGGDSIFWLSQPKGLYVSGYPYIVMVGNLLGDSMVMHPDLSYECRFRLPFWPEYEQKSFVIRTQAEPGDSWEFQPGITATVTDKKDTLCWGVSDSIKTITLSDGKSIRISKQFGLLFSENQTLVGMEGTDKGIQLPVLADFYSDWTEGAVFEKLSTYNENYGSSVSKTWNKYYVLGKTVTPDSIKISVRNLSRRESWFFSNPGSVTFSDTLATLVFLNPNEVKYPGLVKETSAFSDFTSTRYRQTDQGLELSINSVAPPGYGGPIRRDVFVNGIGKTEYEFTYGYIGGHFSRVESLGGYQKTGQTPQGTIHPDSFYGITTSSEAPYWLELPSVFPNPAGDVFNVRCDDCPPMQKADILNLGGQVVETFQQPVFPFAVPANDLPAGVYVLRLLAADGSMGIQKIIVR